MEHELEKAFAVIRALKARHESSLKEIEASLKHIGLDPWPDGRAFLDGKRPWEQHLAMVMGSLKTELAEKNDQIALLRAALEVSRAKFHGLAALVQGYRQGEWQVDFEKLHDSLQDGNVRAQEILSKTQLRACVICGLVRKEGEPLLSDRCPGCYDKLVKGLERRSDLGRCLGCGSHQECDCDMPRRGP